MFLYFEPNDINRIILEISDSIIIYNWVGTRYKKIDCKHSFFQDDLALKYIISNDILIINLWYSNIRIENIEIDLKNKKIKASITTFPRFSPSDIGWELLFQAQMNLYAGGGIQASVNRAQYTYEDARYAFEEARRETISDTRIAYRGVLTAISQVNALHQAVVSAQTALDANQASYEVGAKTSLDVLNSISNLYNQQRNFATARYAYIINLLQLKQAAGNLTLADVERVNHWLSLEDNT